MYSKQEYINLVPYYFRNKPKFKSILEILLQGQMDLNDAAWQILTTINFNSDNTWVLDLLGDLLGQSRNVGTPIYDTNFSWNIYGLGWNQGSWTMEAAKKASSIINNNLYTQVLKFRSRFMRWDGTTQELYTCLNDAFPDIRWGIIDNQNMTVTIKFEFKKDADMAFRQFILNGNLPLDIAGVKILWKEEGLDKFVLWRM